MSESSTAVRIHKRSSYQDATIIPNGTAQDESLSWAARGLLLYCLSLPVGWQIREDDLIGRSPGGRDQLRSIVRELEAHGYIRRSQTRLPNGHVGPADWEVWDVAQSGEVVTAPLTGKPSTEKPSTVKTKAKSRKSRASTDFSPWTGKPSTENPSTTVDGLTVDGKSDSIERKHSSLEVFSRELSSRAVGGSRGECSAIDDPATSDAATVGTADAAPTARTQSLRLPDCAEPHRELVVRWWRARKVRHPDAPNALTARDVAAIEHAAAVGCLPAFLRDAEVNAKRSLSHAYKALCARLAAGGGGRGFDEFRGAYMAAQRRASGQSIAKAMAEYARATSDGYSPEQILAALRAEIRAQGAAERNGGFAACLPDMFRWLRDQRFLAYLPTSPQALSAGPAIRQLPALVHDETL